MALWDRIASRGKVEDRRGLTPVVAGGIGLTGLLAILALNFLAGGDLEDAVTILQEVPVETQQLNTQEYAGLDEYELFASTVLGSNNDTWSKEFSEIQESYEPPVLVLFRTATDSACGTSTSQIGPHYCRLDQTIYLDETFFAELQSRFGAEGGDVAEAYVIAHEVGHHVQNSLGLFETNPDPIQIELQADCLAGVWANSLKDQNVLLPNEIAEAMDAAAAVGDDRIQERTTGYVNPETWTHGSSKQRVSAFETGYSSGDIGACL